MAVAGALKDTAGTRLARTGCKAFCIRTRPAVETSNARCPVPLETSMYPDIGSTLKIGLAGAHDGDLLRRYASTVL